MINYLNFDLDVFDYKSAPTLESFTVRVQHCPQGEQCHSEAEKVTLPIKVRQSIRTLRNRKLTLAELITLGDDLGKALFPPGVRNMLKTCLSQLQPNEEGLRIRLKLDNYALAELPWEYIYLPLSDLPAGQRGAEGFLALNPLISIVRYEQLHTPLVSMDPGVSPLRLVSFLASPNDPNYSPLDLDREKQNIQEAIDGVTEIRSDFYPDATAELLQSALLRPAHIFHFSGHGEFKGDPGTRVGSSEGRGAVILLDNNHRARPLTAQQLARNLTGHSVRLAVLTSCEGARLDANNPWAGVASALAHAGIPAIVGMQYSIYDENAIAFSKAFYHTLAAGQPVDTAVTSGRIAITNRADDQERDWGVPVLYLRSVDGVLFTHSVEPAYLDKQQPEVTVTEQYSLRPKTVDLRMFWQIPVQNQKRVPIPVDHIVDFKEILSTFSGMISGEDKKRMIFITAPRGKGKTCLLAKMEALCKTRMVPCAWIDYKNNPDIFSFDYPYISLAHSIYEQLKISSAELIKALQSLSIPVKSGQEKAENNGQVVDLAVKTGEPPNLHLDIEKIRSPQNIQLLKKIFISGLSSFPQLAVCFISNFDAADSENKEWLKNALLLPIQSGSLPKVVVVVAGQQWPDIENYDRKWTDCSYFWETLPALSSEDIQEYAALTGYNITDEDARFVLKQSGGYPINLGLYLFPKG